MTVEELKKEVLRIVNNDKRLGSFKLDDLRKLCKPEPKYRHYTYHELVRRLGDVVYYKLDTEQAYVITGVCNSTPCVSIQLGNKLEISPASLLHDYEDEMGDFLGVEL